MSRCSIVRNHPGFSLTELLVVIGIVILLVALMLGALGVARSGGEVSRSMNHLRQVSHQMSLYGSDNRDAVLASQFNYHLNAFVGHARCNPVFGDWHARGTWADLLWTHYEMGVFPGAIAASGPEVPVLTDYRFDSPDKALYEALGDIDNALRSTVLNTRAVVDGTGALPFGTGAQEAGLPGFFAANNFFNNDSNSCTYNGAFTYAQIKGLDRSMYLVDSYAGEVIEDEPEPFDSADGDDDDGAPDVQVDFRYDGQCLMLLLDGHVSAEAPWSDLDELEQGRSVRVRDLTAR